MKKFDGLIAGLCTVVELGCIIGLAGIGLKRNEDAYKAEMKCVDLTLDNIMKDCEIYDLKHEIEQLKKNEEEA